MLKKDGGGGMKAGYDRAMGGDPFLDEYFKEVSAFPLLTADEERSLAQQIHSNPQARERLIQSNLRLVISLAKHYTDYGLSLLDLVAEGNLGLIRAVDTFDPSLGMRFTSYAAECIKDFIRRALTERGHLIRVPRNTRAIASKMYAALGRKEEDESEEGAIEKFADELNLTPLQLNRIRQALATYGTSSLDDEIEEGMSVGDAIPDGRAEPPEEILARRQESEHVVRLLDKLSKRESLVLRKRFGIGEDAPLSLAEIGRELGISRERVRQIQQTALRKMQLALQKIGVRDY